MPARSAEERPRVHGLYAAIASSSTSEVVLSPSRHGAALDLLALLYATAAAFLALALLDAQPPKGLRQRWQRRLLAALPLALAALLVNWIGFAAVGVAPLAPPAALLGLFAGALASATALDQRQRSHGFYFLASLPLTVATAFAHRLWLAQLGGHGIDQAGPAVAVVYLLAAVGLGFVLATYFRRRRSGSPLFLGVVASLLIGIGLLTHHLSRLVAVHSIATRRAEFDAAELGMLLLIGVLLLVGAVYLLAQRRRTRSEPPGGTLLRQSARAEPVTGLPTLDVLAESFVRVLRLAVAAKGHCALAVLHFAGLDRIQSTQGRGERDRLYGLAAWRLRTVRRDEELVGAMGDNRFVLVLRVGDAAEATQRVRELVALFDNPLGEGEGRVRLRPSAGVSLWPSHGDDFSRLLANAMVALERCPPGGLQLFHAAQREENEHRLRVEANLGSAIAQGELGLVLQPLVDALSGEVRMVELLARWNNSDLGNVSPRQFILIAESSGVIGEFDRWLLREAISTTKWLDAAGFIDLRVALNCSPVNLADQAFLDYFEKTVRESGINPARIEVEVTEAALAEGERAVVDSLLRLRALGVGLTIDDFGIGHSSLARLRDLPVDSLKIDQSFIRDMDHPKGEFLVSGILGLAHGLGKAVIAEGVETEAQRAALTDLGCEYLQGYLISKPLSWRALLDFLGSNAGSAGPDGEPPGARGRRVGDPGMPAAND
jgi:diguanylate cyclase